MTDNKYIVADLPNGKVWIGLKVPAGIMCEKMTGMRVMGEAINPPIPLDQELTQDEEYHALMNCISDAGFRVSVVPAM